MFCFTKNNAHDHAGVSFGAIKLLRTILINDELSHFVVAIGPHLVRERKAEADSAAVKLARLIIMAVLSRRREAAPIPARSEADRPAPAGWAALRLLADVDISF